MGAPHDRHWSLSRRLTAWYACAAFGIIALMMSFLYWDLLRSLDREDDWLLADKIEQLRGVLDRDPGETTNIEDEIARGSTGSRQARIYIRVTRKNASAVETPGMSREIPPAAFPHPYDLAKEASSGSNFESVSRVRYRVVAAKARFGGPGNGTCVIQVAVARLDDDQLLKRYRWTQWLTLAVAFVACVAVGHVIARRGIRPVEDMARAARRIRSSTLDERIETRSLPLELRTLAETFNEMLQRLGESFARLSRFSADIAHELRTPVQNLQGEAEVGLHQARSLQEYRKVLESNVEECHRLTRVIESLLFLARAESPSIQITREVLDVSRELATVKDFFEASASEAGLTLRLRCPPGIVAELDRTLFQRAVGNLLSNALSHTPSGGEVTIEASQEPPRLRISVADTGSGIPPEHLPHVFDRFYRVDRSRSAAAGRIGLGLAIVKSILDLHHGAVEIESTLGKGTSVCLLFPASA